VHPRSPARVSAPILPVLLYHGVARRSSERFARWNVPPALFAEQMACIAESAIPSTTSSDLDSLPAIHPPPRVLVTFDDGFEDFIVGAVPALRRHNVQSLMYVPTAFVGRTSSWLTSVGEGHRPIMSAEAICDLRREGVEFGAHGHQHRALDQMRRDDARNDIHRSKIVLEDILNERVTTFAYPYGYASRVTREIVRGEGFESACAVRYRVCAVGDDPYNVPRILVTSDVTPDDLLALIRGESRPGAALGDRVRSGVWRAARNAFAAARLR
jgi:peptidoglycan/xylan/chitin deacetylase (PgdA/CDA1 family)